MLKDKQEVDNLTLQKLQISIELKKMNDELAYTRLKIKEEKSNLELFNKIIQK